MYGLFHHLARTPQGKLRLRQYFLRPSLNLDVLHERHDAISILLQASNETLLNDIVKSLKSIKNMKNVVTNLRKGISGGSSKNQGLTSGVWFSLRSVSPCMCISRRLSTDVSVCILYSQCSTSCIGTSAREASKYIQPCKMADADHSSLCN